MIRGIGKVECLLLRLLRVVEETRKRRDVKVRSGPEVRVNFHFTSGGISVRFSESLCEELSPFWVKGGGCIGQFMPYGHQTINFVSVVEMNISLVELKKGIETSSTVGDIFSLKEAHRS